MRSLSVAPVTTEKRERRIRNTKGKTLWIRDEDQEALRQKRCQHLWSGRRRRCQTRWKMARFSSQTGARTLRQWFSIPHTRLLLESGGEILLLQPAAAVPRVWWGDLNGLKSPQSQKDSKSYFDLFLLIVGNKHEFFPWWSIIFVWNDTKFCVKLCVCVSTKTLLLNKTQQPVKLTAYSGQKIILIVYLKST